MKVYAVIVCYRPDVRRLQRLCEELLLDDMQVILVDNTEAPGIAEVPRASGCELLTMGRNTGIAHAQNRGIAAASTARADVILFFDQDSTIAPGFAKTLVSELNLGQPDIVSPRYFDDITDAELPSIRVNRYGLRTVVHRGHCTEPYAVDVVISSGTAATRQVFELAGVFDEGLFIDFVDTEWCLRCRSRHIPIRVVPAAVMRHRIGTKSIDLGLVTILVHSPVRCYYQLRNCFHLFRKHHIPTLFALRETVSVFLGRALLLLFVRNRIAYTKAYVCAVRDGLKGVTGGKPS